MSGSDGAKEAEQDKDDDAYLPHCSDTRIRRAVWALADHWQEAGFGSVHFPLTHRAGPRHAGPFCTSQAAPSAAAGAHFPPTLALQVPDAGQTAYELDRKEASPQALLVATVRDMHEPLLVLQPTP